MAVFTEPTKWAQTLGQDADVTTIPDTAGDTDPSIDKIFPSVFSIPLARGGRAIPRSVLNGLFKLLGDWCFYQQNGGIASYSETIDYAVGSFVKYNNALCKCIQANGPSTTVTPPTDMSYWSKVPTLLDLSTTFANNDLSNLSAMGLNVFSDPSFSNVNDTANILMAHNAMPSDAYDNLTLGASGTTYTAPADGYIYIHKNASASSQYLEIILTAIMAARIYATSSSDILKICIPISKSQSFTVNYSLGGTTNTFRFIYAFGSKSEQGA